MNSIMTAVISVVALVAGAVVAVVAVLYSKSRTNSRIESARREIEEARMRALSIEKEAQRDAENSKKEALIGVKEEILKLKQTFETEEQQRKHELHTLENRIIQREESLDRRTDALDRREHKITCMQGELDKRSSELDQLITQQTSELERIAELSQEEAHAELLEHVRKNTAHEQAQIIRESEQRIRSEADKCAREVISTAIQRCAVDVAGKIMVTSVHIPSDDLKGRIIGREGRNIRTFEQITGVSLVIDDTPETVVLSSFDPIRRETARIALENLIADGRIHPARIEDMYKKAETLVLERVREAGEQATFETGIHDLHPKLVETLGALHYRTSFGQNVLDHSKEVAALAGVMASEINFDVLLAKRAGLLHDLGKALDYEVEGPHAVIGADLARRYGERPDVVHAIEAHHADVEPNTVLDVLVQAADAISAGRPGARRESAEAYIKRLEKLEEISNAHDGVERTYAMQAGRELHIMVEPERISDAEAVVLAHDIAREIEDGMEYPGQVRVVVIRESRAVNIAK